MSAATRTSDASRTNDASPTSPTRSNRRRILHRGSVGMIVGGLIAVVGSLLPWVMTPFGSLSGTAGPGLWTLSAGFIAIAGALLPYRKVAIAHCLGPGFAVAAIVVWQVARLVQLSAVTGGWGELLPGMGLVMAAGSAVILLRTGFRLISTT
jgi:hypothetical protein